MYIHLHIYIYVCIYTYTDTHIYREREREYREPCKTCSFHSQCCSGQLENLRKTVASAKNARKDESCHRNGVLPGRHESIQDTDMVYGPFMWSLGKRMLENALAELPLSKGSSNLAEEACDVAHVPALIKSQLHSLMLTSGYRTQTVLSIVARPYPASAITLRSCSGVVETRPPQELHISAQPAGHGPTEPINSLKLSLQSHTPVVRNACRSQSSFQVRGVVLCLPGAPICLKSYSCNLLPKAGLLCMFYFEP